MLLRARDQTARKLPEEEEMAVRTYFQSVVGDLGIDLHPQVTRWARLRLPNGQIARSAWKECLKPIEQVRMARQVAVRQCALFCFLHN